jgi:hypothetical protein
VRRALPLAKEDGPFRTIPKRGLGTCLESRHNIWLDHYRLEIIVEVKYLWRLNYTPIMTLAPCSIDGHMHACILTDL